MHKWICCCVLLLNFSFKINAALIEERSLLPVFEVDSASQQTIELVKQGMMKMQGNDLYQAKNLFLEASSLNPSDPIPLLALANLHIQSKQISTASQYLNKAVLVSPNSVEVLVSMARFYESQEKYHQAEKYYLAAIASKPNSVVILNDLGMLYLQQLKNSHLANDKFMQAFQVAPDSVIAHYGLALSYANLNQFEKAIQHFERVIELRPDDATTYQSLGRLLAKTNQLKKSLEILNQGIQINADFVPLLMDRADVNSALKNTQEAVTDYKKVTQILPSSPFPYIRLGALYESLGNLAAAEQAYRRVISLDPEQAAAYNNLAWLSTITGSNLDEALIFANKAVHLSNNEPVFMDTLAWVYRAKGDLLRAQLTLQKVVKSQPNANAYYHLGIVQKERNLVTEAKISLQKALSMNRNFEHAEAAQQLLDSI